MYKFVILLYYFYWCYGAPTTREFLPTNDLFKSKTWEEIADMSLNGRIVKHNHHKFRNF